MESTDDESDGEGALNIRLRRVMKPNDATFKSSVQKIRLADSCLKGCNCSTLGKKRTNREAVIQSAALKAADRDECPRRPFACSKCKSRFRIKGHLSQHYRYVHEKHRPHSCRLLECNATFSTGFARDQHMWTVHEGKKPFVCEFPQCEAYFGQRSHLNRHIKSHQRRDALEPKATIGASSSLITFKAAEAPSDVFKTRFTPRELAAAAEPNTPTSDVFKTRYTPREVAAAAGPSTPIRAPTPRRGASKSKKPYAAIFGSMGKLF